MNREQFTNAMDGISDGLIDAAAGAYEKKSDQKRTLTCVLRVACAALVLASAGLFWYAQANTANTQPTISVENPTTAPATQSTETEPTQPSENQEGIKVAFLSTRNGEKTETPLGVGIATPIDYVVYVRDLRGLNDEERSEVEKEWREFEKTMQSGDAGYTSTSYVYGDMIIGTYMKGFIGITSGKSKIHTISVDTVNEGVGNYGECNDPNNFGVLWYLNPKVLRDDPGTPLSSIRDSLEITIDYADGTTEIVIIDISMNDEGQVFATLAEDPAGV